MDKTGHRVWIELERPSHDLLPEERERIGDERAALATRMLHRLCGPEETDGPRASFWWRQGGKHGSCYCYGNAGGFVELSDNGHWLNLSYLGREDTEGRYPGPWI